MTNPVSVKIPITPCCNCMPVAKSQEYEGEDLKFTCPECNSWWYSQDLKLIPVKVVTHQIIDSDDLLHEKLTLAEAETLLCIEINRGAEDAYISEYLE